MRYNFSGNIKLGTGRKPLSWVFGLPKKDRAYSTRLAAIPELGYLISESSLGADMYMMCHVPGYD